MVTSSTLSQHLDNESLRDCATTRGKKDGRDFVGGRYERRRVVVVVVVVVKGNVPEGITKRRKRTEEQGKDLYNRRVCKCSPCEVCSGEISLSLFLFYSFSLCYRKVHIEIYGILLTECLGHGTAARQCVPLAKTCT